MSPRMINPSLLVPDALQPLLDISKVINKIGVPVETLDLIRLRVSQLNGRAIVLPGPEGAGEKDKRLHLVARWRDVPDFNEAECAALALAEATTHLGDGEDPVPDEVWAEVARHYNEQELGALVMQIGLVNLWNRVNLATKEGPAEWSWS